MKFLIALAVCGVGAFFAGGEAPLADAAVYLSPLLERAADAPPLRVAAPLLDRHGRELATLVVSVALAVGYLFCTRGTHALAKEDEKHAAAIRAVLDSRREPTPANGATREAVALARRAAAPRPSSRARCAPPRAASCTPSHGEWRSPQC